jgi:hypothetical protein
MDPFQFISICIRYYSDRLKIVVEKNATSFAMRQGLRDAFCTEDSAAYHWIQHGTLLSLISGQAMHSYIMTRSALPSNNMPFGWDVIHLVSFHFYKGSGKKEKRKKGKNGKNSAPPRCFSARAVQCTSCPPFPNWKTLRTSTAYSNKGWFGALATHMTLPLSFA